VLLDAASGAERWRFETGKDIYSSPVISGGVLFIGTEEECVWALG